MFIETFATDYVPLLLLNESHWKIAIRKMLRFSVENRLPIRRTKFEVDYTQIEYHLWLSLDYEERNKICNWFWFAHFSFTGLIPPSAWWFRMQTHSRHNLNEIQSNTFHFEWGKKVKSVDFTIQMPLEIPLRGLRASDIVRQANQRSKQWRSKEIHLSKIGHTIFPSLARRTQATKWCLLICIIF